MPTSRKVPPLFRNLEAGICLWHWSKPGEGQGQVPHSSAKVLRALLETAAKFALMNSSSQNLISVQDSPTKKLTVKEFCSTQDLSGSLENQLENNWSDSCRLPRWVLWKTCQVHCGSWQEWKGTECCQRWTAWCMCQLLQSLVHRQYVHCWGVWHYPCRCHLQSATCFALWADAIIWHCKVTWHRRCHPQCSTNLYCAPTVWVATLCRLSHAHSSLKQELQFASCLLEGFQCSCLCAFWLPACCAPDCKTCSMSSLWLHKSWRTI